MIRLTLPIPVSVNSLYHNNFKNKGSGGRSKTKKAKSYEMIAKTHLCASSSKYGHVCANTIEARSRYYNFQTKKYRIAEMNKDHPHLGYYLSYVYYFSGEHVVDLCNYEKQLTDFLVSMGFMLDDSFVLRFTAERRADDPKNPRVDCFIQTVDKRFLV